MGRFSLRRQTILFTEKQEKFNSSLTSKVPPLTDSEQKEIRQMVNDYVQLAFEEERDLREKEYILKFGTRRGSLTKPVSWKHKIKGGDDNDNCSFDKSKFIWDGPETAGFLTAEQKAELTRETKLVIERVETEREFKFLQLRVVIHLLDRLVAQAAAAPSDMRQIRKLVGLKVLRKSFSLQQVIGCEAEPFDHASQVLNYSWRLFKDKEILPKNVLLDDPHNPQVKFNVEKFNEFRFGTELCTPNVHDAADVQAFFDELDTKAYKALVDKANIKRSPYLPIIDLVVEKFSGKGQGEVAARKPLSATMKNREALKFLDLWERVSKNQRKAMIDARLSKMNKQDLAAFQANKRASDRADAQFAVLRRRVDFENHLRQVEAERTRKLSELKARRNLFQMPLERQGARSESQLSPAGERKLKAQASERVSDTSLDLLQNVNNQFDKRGRN